MSQTTTTMAQQCAPLKLRPKVFECWDKLSPVGKDSCIGTCELESLRGTYGLARVWPTSGCLQHHWDDFIADYLPAICQAEEEQRSRKKFTMVQFILLMASCSNSRTEATPTVVVIHQSGRIARDVVSLMKRHPVAGGYGFNFHAFKMRWELSMDRPYSGPQRPQPSISNVLSPEHAPYRGCLQCKDRQLRCDETSPECLNCVQAAKHCGGYSEPAPHAIFSGAVTLWPMPQRLVIYPQGQKHRKATAGGFLKAGTVTYLLTVAHPFLREYRSATSDRSSSTSTSESELDDSDKEGQAKSDTDIWIGQCVIDVVPSNNAQSGKIPFRDQSFVPPNRHMRPGNFSIADVAEDWLLIQCVGFDLQSSYSGPECHAPAASSHGPPPSDQKVYVLHGTKETRTCRFLAIGATLYVPWRKGGLNVWIADIATGPGDSGTWITQTDNTWVGMVIGYSAQLNQTYVVSAHNLFANLKSFAPMAALQATDHHNIERLLEAPSKPTHVRNSLHQLSGPESIPLVRGAKSRRVHEGDISKGREPYGYVENEDRLQKAKPSVNDLAGPQQSRAIQPYHDVTADAQSAEDSLSGLSGSSRLRKAFGLTSTSHSTPTSAPNSAEMSFLPRRSGDEYGFRWWECCQCAMSWSWRLSVACAEPSCQHVRCLRCQVGHQPLSKEDNYPPRRS